MKLTIHLLLIVLILSGKPLFSYAMDTVFAATNTAKNQDPLSTIVFKRVNEPREQAFSLLIPQGWQIDGGIFRVDPTAQSGPAQSIAAKLDFAVKNPQGSLMIRWLPEMLYYDARHSPAGQMGLFPPGSNYQGMPVYPLMSAKDFLSQMAFPYTHPKAVNTQIIEYQKLPQLAQKFQQHANIIMPQLSFSYEAALLALNYVEDGVQYTEKMVTVIENWGQLGAGMWGNKETFLVRTPIHEFAKWEAIFSVILHSVILNSQWIANEVKGQMQRSQILIETQRDIQKIEQEIVQHRQQTNTEINNNMFLTLTGQESYINPFTQQVDIGSNQWQNRWTNEAGDVIYTNQTDYNPNHDPQRNLSGFKKTPVKNQ